MPSSRTLHRPWSAALAVRCGGCGDALAAAPALGPWCVHCRDRWGPVPGAWSPAGACPGWAAAVYRGRVRRAVLQAKRGAPAALAALLLARLPPEALPSGATVTWVPAHPRRVLLRPDAGRRLAEAVAAREGLSTRQLLRRSPLGRRQAGRTDAARRRDPERLGLRAMASVPPVVVLVDDVRTTGTTLDHAGALLRAAGAQQVVAVVAATSPQALQTTAPAAPA